MYECRAYSFKKDTSGKLTTWKSSGIDNYSVNSDLRSVPDGSAALPTLNNDRRMSVSFSENYFKQNKVVHPNTKNVVNIYIVYKLDQIGYGRNTDFTVQNALFGAMKITDDATTSDHNKYVGYGIFFDEGSSFSFENIVNGKNVIILVVTCLLVLIQEINKITFMC